MKGQVSHNDHLKLFLHPSWRGSSLNTVTQADKPAWWQQRINSISLYCNGEEQELIDAVDLHIWVTEWLIILSNIVWKSPQYILNLIKTISSIEYCTVLLNKVIGESRSFEKDTEKMTEIIIVFHRVYDKGIGLGI